MVKSCEISTNRIITRSFFGDVIKIITARPEYTEEELREEISRQLILELQEAFVHFGRQLEMKMNRAKDTSKINIDKINQDQIKIASFELFYSQLNLDGRFEIKITDEFDYGLSAFIQELVTPTIEKLKESK